MQLSKVDTLSAGGDPNAGNTLHFKKMTYLPASLPKMTNSLNRSSNVIHFRNCSSKTSTRLLLAPPSDHNTFMNLMEERFNCSGAPPQPPSLMMGVTENNSPTYLSTGNPCLDFFFHVVPDTPSESVVQRLEQAWAHDPLTTLKLVCNLRGIRGTGKSDREGYYTSALWIHENHPKTLACNLDSLIKFGYFKDVLEILYRLLEGADVRQKQRQIRQDYLYRKSSYGRYGYNNRSLSTLESGGDQENSSGDQVKDREEAKEDSGKSKEQIAKEKKREMRKKKKIEMAKKLVERIGEDNAYLFLHECVSDLFADYLKMDVAYLQAGELNKIGLSGKWCPSLNSGFDRTIFLCDTIARKVFPRNSRPEYKGMKDSVYGVIVRHRLRKEVLVPLRRALHLPEVYIGAKDWKSIPYNRVASMAMRKYKDKFFEHDRERFTEYLGKVKAGKTTIAAGGLLPHEIIASLNYESDDEVADLQWKRMVSDLAGKGKLKNCMAICDVSGSMEGTPMDVSVALGLLISELSEEPWKGKLITFSANPELHVIQGDDLRSKKSFVERMQWNMNTDFQKVFDLILKVAVSGNLKEEDMIKRLFVFSDMEFDEASGSRNHGYGYYGGYSHYEYNGRDECRNWETDYEVICKKFKEHGYGNCVPEIVFWNLRDSKSTPVMANQKGVALVSGYSKNLIKLFLEESGEMNPEMIMEAAISGQEYQDLVIID